MIVLGYRAGANFNKATSAIAKHTNISLAEAKKLTQKIENGEGVTLPDDFVLREDLEELNFLLT